MSLKNDRRDFVPQEEEGTYPRRDSAGYKRDFVPDPEPPAEFVEPESVAKKGMKP